MSSDTTSPAIRRIVAGQTKDGASVLASETNVEATETPLLPGAKFYSLWGADSIPSLPNDGAEPAFRTWFPPDGGFRFELIVLPPEGTKPPAKRDVKSALAETEKWLPGLIGTMDPRHPGMHRTDTVDLIYVTQGACVLALDGGKDTALSAGDTIVLNGPRHAWRNPHAEPCGLLTVSLGVKREG
ncbi:MAG TPA: cupin domain-containing protein [Methyloceanibacter sp.]|nr:cupin domain-containing protein [Methyloceanibacter sp.]